MSTYQAELQTQVVREGVKLKIVAGKCGDGEWELSVEDERGLRTVWSELFASGRYALEVGANSIATEGIAPFVDHEGFEYLLRDE